MKISTKKKLAAIKAALDMVRVFFPMLQARARGVQWAFVAVILPDNSGYGIGQACFMEYGYYPVTDLGAACTWEDACKAADTLNRSIGISPEEAARISCTTFKRRSDSQPVGLR